MFGSLIPKRESFLLPTTDRFTRLMNRMEEEMEEMMERYGGWLTPSLGFVPKVDLVEAENQFEVSVDLPGMKPEEVDIELKNGELWISGKHEERKEEEGKTYHRIERRQGEFRRVVPLLSSISEEQIEARFENGVLRIVIPKSEEAKTKHIEVKS